MHILLKNLSPRTNFKNNPPLEKKIYSRSPIVLITSIILRLLFVIMIVNEEIRTSGVSIMIGDPKESAPQT